METIFVYGVGLALTSVMVKNALSWPNDIIGDRKITYSSIWKILTLICYITSQIDVASTTRGMALFGLLTVGALSYGNTRAAMEWAFLSVLGTADLSMFLSLWDTATLHDKLNVLVSVDMLFSVLIPTLNWWKYLSLYVFFMAYPERKEPLGG